MLYETHQCIVKMKFLLNFILKLVYKQHQTCPFKNMKPQIPARPK